MKIDPKVYQNIVEIIDKFTSDTIVICSESLKKKIITTAFEKGFLLKIQFKNIIQATYDLYGEYSKMAIVEICRRQKYNYNNANILLKLMPVVDKEINDKTRKLVKLKEETRQYLTINELSKYEYLNNNVVIIHEGIIDYSDFSLAILLKQLVCNNITFDNIILNYEQTYNPKVISFKKAKNEVFYIFNEIAKLLDEGIASSNIIIHSSNSEYNSIIKEASCLFNIDVCFCIPSSLYSYDISKKFIDILNSNGNQYISELAKLFVENHLENELYADKIIAIINEYVGLDLKINDVKELIIEQVKATNINNEQYQNVINITNIYQDIPKKDAYVFIIGANQGSFPRVFKDDEYLLDYEKNKLNLPTAVERNLSVKKKWEYIIRTLENVVITYSYSLPSSEQFRSAILDDCVSDTLNGDDLIANEDKIYSEPYAQLELAKKMEKYEKFDEIDLKLRQYFDIFKDNNRKFSYKNNQFSTMYKPQKLILSYTAIDEYFQCPYRYYLNRVLKIKKDYNPEYLKLGNLFHHVLKEVLEKNIDINAALIDYYIVNNLELTEKDKMFNNVYKKFLTDIISEIREFNENSYFKILGLEKEYEVHFDTIDDTEIYLVGKIDKIMTGIVDDEAYALVIDYKTKGSSFSLDDMIYGLDMQIPIYFYLINNSSNKKYKFGGGYLQSLIPATQFGYDMKADYCQQLANMSRLNGYSSSNIRVLYAMNNTFENGSCFEGVSLKKDNDFKSHSLKRIFNDQEFEKLLALTKENISKATNKILSGDFSINPLYTSSDRGCDYCPYGEICFFDKKTYNRQKQIAIHEYLKEVEK